MSTEGSSPQDPTQSTEPPVAECLGRYRHHFEWMWSNGQWLDRIKCMNCGEEREKTLTKIPVV